MQIYLAEYLISIVIKMQKINNTETFVNHRNVIEINLSMDFQLLDVYFCMIVYIQRPDSFKFLNSKYY